MRARRRSRSARVLETPLSMIHVPGPTITPFAEVPYEPGVGAVNAPTLNHLPTEGSARFGFDMIFGRIVTCAGVVLVVLAVPTGSLPVHSGVRNWPVAEAKIELISQPPKSTSPNLAVESQRLPFPRGS